MLTLEDVTFTRDGFSLTADLSLAPGSRTAIIGPSGGGKSTLLSLIAGFEMPDAGRILHDGTDITPLPPSDRPVAMLFQDGNLFPHLDVLTNVALGIEPVARPSSAAQKRAREALERVGLTEHTAKKPGALSGGQQSRAALARLLLTARPVVLLDEPFAALGPSLRRQMFDLLVELLPGATILMVTHDPDEARRSAGQVIFVDGGRAEAPVDVNRFFDAPSAAVSAYLA
ncbi:ATP-binding cassette domain-containing protein [Alphaproteobacteria bacterium GH1-50]|uniref:ATP-binding cassette domain-containing protein n=1 Tax=Kangsaoukella pontilimi TaxID=2691042 RepID=A0A7C9MAW3_9RHOB|nr:ATP-binding cassette domain-containing protein [Kangsaoukella pontilimi]MXQ08333.1 ATP-binding cassette domain-containing protein [Kangsaoukella pontilimi]